MSESVQAEELLADRNGNEAWRQDYERAKQRGLGALDDLSAGDRVFVSSACAEPKIILSELVSRARHHDVVGTTTFMMLNGSTEIALGLRGTENEIVSINAGPNYSTDFYPWTIFHTVELMGDREVVFDVALIHASRPDKHGYVSLGVSVDFAVEAIAQSRLVVAEINARMPYTHGNNQIHVSRLNGLIETDYELPEAILPHPSPDARQVAGYVLEYIPDGATIEIGVGRIMSGVLTALEARNDIGLHTGLFIDEMIDLIQGGVINNSRKLTDKGVSVANQGRGTSRMYQYVHENPSVHFMPASYTHDPAVLRQLPNFRAINSALEIDLMGRVNSEIRDGQRVSSTGGLGDFVRAARYQPGARSIIALTATSGGGEVTRIVPQLPSPEAVTLTPDLADIVVTEFGSAVLRGKRPRERAQALTAISDPRHRAALTEAYEGIYE
jgi:4-hydroxybutyrate CoA-transferase